KLCPCRPYLPLTSHRAAYSGRGSLPLGLQIVGIVLIGFPFAFLVVLCFFRRAEVPNWNRKFNWGIVAAIFFTATPTFYGWEFTGNPGAIWCLCEPVANG